MLLKTKGLAPIYYLVVGLVVNIIVLAVLHFLENYLGNNLLELKDSERIMDNITSFSIFLILVAPILEELLYRLPIKKNNYTFIVTIQVLKKQK